MIEYFTTDNENIIEKVDTDSVNIDLSSLIDRYLALKSEFQALPEEKITPDQETLDFWNEKIILEKVILEDRIKNEARILYRDVKPIFDAGLLPEKYEDEYLQLENFINT